MGTYFPTLDENFKFAPEVAEQIAGDSFLPLPYTANVVGAYEIDPANGVVQALTVTGDVTLTLAEPPANFTTPITLWLMQDDTGGHAVTMPACLWASGVVPTPGTDAGREDDYYFVGVPGLGWRGFLSGGSMA